MTHHLLRISMDYRRSFRKTIWSRATSCFTSPSSRRRSQLPYQRCTKFVYISSHRPLRPITSPQPPKPGIPTIKTTIYKIYIFLLVRDSPSHMARYINTHTHTHTNTMDRMQQIIARKQLLRCSRNPKYIVYYLWKLRSRRLNGKWNGVRVCER